MINISEVVNTILQTDSTALEAMNQGILNLSAYAQKIHPLVEARAKKYIRTGSIVVALSRIAKLQAKQAQITPVIAIDELIIKSKLQEITYIKSKEVIQELSSINKTREKDTDFFVITQGIREVTVIGSESIIQTIQNDISAKPKSLFTDLTAITVSFDQKYLEIPDVIHIFVSSLAVRHINLIEIISTFTELSFIVEHKDVQPTIEALNHFLV